MEPSVDALIEHVEFHVVGFEEPTADLIAPVDDGHATDEAAADGDATEEGDH